MFSTVLQTQVWLNDLIPELDWEGQPHKAYLALRTVLHALRDRSPSRRRSTWAPSYRCSCAVSTLKAGRSKGNHAKSDTKKIFSVTIKDASGTM